MSARIQTILLALCGAIITTSASAQTPAPNKKIPTFTVRGDIDCESIWVDSDLKRLCQRQQMLAEQCSTSRCAATARSIGRTIVRGASSKAVSKAVVAALESRLATLDTLTKKVDDIAADTGAIRMTVNRVDSNVNVLVGDTGEIKDGVARVEATQAAHGQKLGDVQLKLDKALARPTGCAALIAAVDAAKTDAGRDAAIRAAGTCYTGSAKTTQDLVGEMEDLGPAFASFTSPDGGKLVYDGRPDPFAPKDDGPLFPAATAPIVGGAAAVGTWLGTYLDGQSGKTQAISTTAAGVGTTLVLWGLYELTK